MKTIKLEQTIKNKNSDVCTAIEYPLRNKDINVAVIKLNGRYPDSGRAVNTVCKELAYIINGSGKLIVEGQVIELKKGDLVLIEAGEKYYWISDMEMLVPCVPAWYPEQHTFIS